VSWNIKYGISFRIPDIILFRNGSPDSWFYSQKNDSINRRDDLLLNLETVKNYLLKNAFDENSVVILRSKSKSNEQKEY